MSVSLPPGSMRGDVHDGGQLLAALQERLFESLLPALERALAESAEGQYDQGRVVQRLRQAVVAGFHELPTPKPAPVVDLASLDLGLVSEAALDTQLACEQMIDGMSRPNARSLESLGSRLARAASRESLRAGENPLAPAFIVKALNTALEEADPDVGHRMQALRSVEQVLATALAQAYQACEEMLASGKLPVRARSAPAAMHPRATAGSRPGQAAGGAVDGMLFSHLLKLLDSRQPAREEQQLFDPGTVTPSVPAIGSSELLSILALMQHEMRESAPAPAGSRETLAERLRRDVAMNARKLGVTGERVRLQDTDEEAIGLMARLFDSLLEGTRFDSRARRKIDRLLVPYTRVALRDRYMFDSREHPAWRLLNTVAEACAGEGSDASQERELLDRVDRTIDRLVAEFNEDVAIFETLEQELRGYMAQNRKRFELAERRAAQARLGRERLEQARKDAAGEIQHRRGGRELPALVGDFLDQHVAHHLTQVVLRDGPDSPRYAEAMQAVDDLLAAFDRTAQGQAAGDAQPLPRAALEAVLASSGFVGASAALVIDELEEILSPPPIEDAPAPPIPDAMQAEESESPAPPDAPASTDDAESPPGLAIVGGNDQLDFDEDVLARARSLRVGDWLQLLTASGRMEPAKISWVSPISSRLLLVNRRGVRVLTASTAELAAMAKLGKLRFDNA